MKRFVILALMFASTVCFAQQDPQDAVAPECRPATLPSDYDNDQQYAFLQNYFAALLIATPMGPIIPYDKGNASVGIEVGYLPPLSCAQRLVKVGNTIKTENTSILPVLPRPRLVVRLPDAGPISFAAGLSIVPPFRFPFGTFLIAGGDIAAGWRSDFGLGVGIRGHLNMARIRAEIATPLKKDSPAYDDVFYAAAYGGDLGLSYQLPWQAVDWLTVFGSAGYAASQTLFIIGDNIGSARTTITQNYKYPWHNAVLAIGAQAWLWKHLDVSVEVSSALPFTATVKGKIAFVW